MKRTVVVATLFVLGLAPTARANEEDCTLEDIRGTYAYTLTGFLTDGPNAGPLAAVGSRSATT